MVSKKDDIVNKAIELTRNYRPVEYDSKTGKPMIRTGASMDMNVLISLCVSIQNFLYGDENDGKQK